MTNNDGRSSKLEDDFLRDVRTELDRSTEDLHRLTERVKDQNVALERLEVLVTEVFNLLASPALAVDVNGLIAAVSQGAREHELGLSRDIVGKPATSALPTQLANAILAVARAQEHPQQEVQMRTRKPEDATHWVDVEGAQVVALPGGWALAVLSE